MARLDSLEPAARSALRIVAGLLFTCHGLQKLIGAFGGINGAGAHVHYASLLGVAAILESVGGALLMLGLFTVPTAFILSGEMAVGYFRGHFPHGFWPIRNGGELAVLYCFIWLYLFTAGAGPLSLDAIVRRKK